MVKISAANSNQNQVQQELSSTFARLCHLVDESTAEMKEEAKSLEREVRQLEEIAGRSKVITYFFFLHSVILFHENFISFPGAEKSGHFLGKQIGDVLNHLFRHGVKNLSLKPFQNFAASSYMCSANSVYLYFAELLDHLMLLGIPKFSYL